MAQYDVDLFVIGAGSGGVRAARIAAGHGAKVMIAEEYRVGGTCVIRGCVPKKLLVYASRYSHDFVEAAGFGWTVPQPSFDWTALIANKDREIARLEAAYTSNLEKAGVEVVMSRAMLDDAHNVRLMSTGAHVRAEHVLISTGGQPFPGHSIPGIEHVISSNDVFHLPELPRRIFIHGGGYIAIEFACVFAGLGSQVTLVCRAQNILRGFDDDVRAHVRAEMERDGIEVVTGRTVARVDKPGALRARLDDGREIEADRILFAIGRSPNVSGFGLQEAGVNIAETGGIAVDPYSRSSLPHLRRHGLRRQADAGRSRQRADRGVLRARGRRRRPDRDRGAGALPDGAHLSHRVPAAAGDPVGPPDAHADEARGRRRYRPRGGLPHRRARRRRDDPAPRHRGEDGRHQGRPRRHFGGASDRRRGAGDHARAQQSLRPRSRAVT